MIIWDEKKPEGLNMPAATGKCLNGLIQAVIWWQNVKGYFEPLIKGDGTRFVVPGEFETLAQAKVAADQYATRLVKGAAADNEPAQAVMQLTLPSGNKGTYEIDWERIKGWPRDKMDSELIYHFDILLEMVLGRESGLKSRQDQKPDWATLVMKLTSFAGYLDRAGLHICTQGDNGKYYLADDSRVKHLIEMFVLSKAWQADE